MWNGNKFSIYDNEEKTVLKMMKDLGDQTNSNTDTLDTKTDKTGNHEGSWQGLNKPTLSQEGVAATVELHITEIANIKTDIQTNATDITNVENDIISIESDKPYEEYTRTKLSPLDGKYKYYGGFSNFSKKTYGRYEQATVMSVIGNEDNPIPQVLGTDTEGLASYTNRDSVALYVVNNGGNPTLTIASGMVYTATTATVPVGVDMSVIKVGMIVDIGTTVNGDWAVGIIQSIDGRVLTMEDGFYQVRNDSTPPAQVTPLNGLQCRVQMTNKVWNINSNLIVNAGCPAGANLELGVFAYHTNINDVGGIDLINLAEATHYGVKVRAGEHPFLDGFISDGNGRHFVGKKGTSNTPLLQGIDDYGSVFEISMDGSMNKQIYKIQTLNGTGDLAPNVAIVIMTSDTANLQLPFANTCPGRIIEVVATGTNNLVTAQNGNGISIVDTQSQQISISKGAGKTHRSARFLSDGGTSWFKISDLF